MYLTQFVLFSEKQELQWPEAELILGASSKLVLTVQCEKKTLRTPKLRRAARDGNCAFKDIPQDPGKSDNGV